MKTILVVCMCFFLGSMLVAQTVYTLDNRENSGAQFTSLATAVNTAADGDIIYIHPSPIAYVNVTIDKKLTLIGLGHYPDFTNGETASIGSITLGHNSGGSLIKGLRIPSIFVVTGNSPTDVAGTQIINNRISAIVVPTDNAFTSDFVIEGNYFSSQQVNIAPGALSNNWEIKNNFMRGHIAGANSSCFITNNVMITTQNNHNFFEFCESPFVNNNMFLGTGNLTEIGLLNSTVEFENNITFSYSGSIISALNGDNNLDNTNPLFVNVPSGFETDFYANDYNLMAGSPGINAGSDGTDIGIFGNNFEFDTNGIPELMPYPVSINVTNSVIAPGQPLNVEFSAIQKN